jgi:CxxC motif-containing protein (DUF1111 family)
LLMNYLGKIQYFLLSFFPIGILFSSICYAQDITNLAGDLSSDNPPNIALELPAPNISSEERVNFHLSTHFDFHRTFELVKQDKKYILGPNFNNDSCGGCHFKNGRGEIKFSNRLPGSPMIIKVSLPGLNKDGSPKDVPGIGEQLQDQVLNGKTRFGIKLQWKKLSGRYPDGTAFTLRSPILSYRIPNIDRKKIVDSLRMTPPVVGMGLLDTVSDADIIAMSDPKDSNKDGISGKVSYVLDRKTKKKAIGRFGFRATHPNLEQQSAAALFHDMGLTNKLFKINRQKQEISNEQLDRTVFYLQAAGVPKARNQDDPYVIAGKEVFQQLNCQGCHKMTLKTGASSVPEIANQEIHPFTDLLLHDMGSGLADKRPEFSASGNEWRTTPLWGLGLHRSLTRKSPGYLHDGRARTIEEAILWHGGEAQKSREQFKALSIIQRDQLIKFLQSL